jgi:hypothetical protein
VKRYIHVNQHVIRDNAKTGERNPVITVKSYKDNQYGHTVEVHGPCRIVYRPDNPLPCGAKVWIETEEEVTVHGNAETETDACPANQAAAGCNLG